MRIYALFFNCFHLPPLLPSLGRLLFLVLRVGEDHASVQTYWEVKGCATDG